MPTTPSKRRKLNNGDQQVSPSKGRSLDFFFGKQQAAKKDAPRSSPKIANNNELYRSDCKSEEKEEGSSDADEAYARRLQAQFDEESRAQAGETTASVQSIDDGALKPEIIHVPEDKTESQLESPIASAAPSTAIEPRKQTLSLQSAAASKDVISDTVPFDENPLTFDPGKYLPDLRKQWVADGGDVTFSLLTGVLSW